ncbi:MAG: hypothetical protein GX868_17330, partial [Actinobacteria bacterium]|nr:hypothetical protein [Actinomycetota bacterium]
MSFRPTAAVVAASMLLIAACTGSDTSEPPESSPTPTTAPFVAYTPEFVEGPCVV